MGLEKPILHVPAPWSLVGEGIILIYKFRAAWIGQHALLTPSQCASFSGGLGYVMLVNYLSSPVGPYRELLVIPGKFYPHRRQSITKIYVDTDASTANGRFNWGIPKETKPFTWRCVKDTDSIIVGEESAPILTCRIRSGGPAVPITTKLLPIRLHQELEGATFRTNPCGSGWARLCRVESLTVDPLEFPDISRVKPLACLKVSPFRLNFPMAE